MGEGQHGSADGHQEPADSDDAGTVNPVPEVAQEDDEHAVTDLRDRETKGSHCETSINPIILLKGT